MSIRHLIAAVLTALSFAAGAAVDVNQASQAELETVKGIGPSLSTKILAARQQAQFKDWADMVDRVGGVGPGNAARFSQAGLTVAGAAYAGGDAAKPAKKGAKAGDAANLNNASNAAQTKAPSEAAAGKTAKPSKPGTM